ncbi:peptidoglycan-binding domain-containing protein [Streptomyces sp. DSM 15324]|uniref:peptidoglycan-binding domain-containing protein n=1 Tax=Streptomyces sp. DSM 15324 TaxID=1739111 RepID=UPI000747C464|nr:peptidoglycan-binding domain-containing protein [Streptomyces sp. DSM 15324]KUO14183.1 hypothetical protein AQJ58_03850 [Streptomyces sp. DSM 15324]
MSDRTGWPGRPGPPHGHPCPECGALRAADNTPSCTCARRASDALRDTRTAEAAAAEDFDPLRIRPYVELEETPAAGRPGAGGAGTGNAVDATMTLRAVPGAEATAPPGASPASDATMRLPRVPPVPRPFRRGPSAGEPGRAEAAGRPGPGDAEPVRGLRRRVLVIAATGAAVAVVAAAGFASGLFTYEKPTRDGAAPKDVRASVPDSSASAASASAPRETVSPSESSAPPPPAAHGERPSPTPAESSASPSAAPSATASTTVPTAPATATIGTDRRADGGRQTIATPVLRLGDKGDEVTELQLRLAQLSLYDGEANGTFTSEVETAVRTYQWARGLQEDEPGVYGAATRASLESETKEP